MSAQLLEALTDCVNVMEHELNGLAVIQPELKFARAAIADALRENFLVPPVWTGEGLPPVGTVCEALVYDGNGQQVWREARVIHHHPRHEGSAAIAHGAEDLLAWSSDFRPIRTPEQIAAEERNAVIEQMILVDEKGSLSRTYFCGLLYDAGYRKQVQP